MAIVEAYMADDDVENTPDLSISPEKVCYIIAKAPEFDAKDVVTDPEDDWRLGPGITFREHEGRGYWRGETWTDF